MLHIQQKRRLGYVTKTNLRSRLLKFPTHLIGGNGDASLKLEFLREVAQMLRSIESLHRLFTVGIMSRCYMNLIICAACEEFKYLCLLCECLPMLNQIDYKMLSSRDITLLTRH